jgi:hypothetical protein
MGAFLPGLAVASHTRVWHTRPIGEKYLQSFILFLFLFYISTQQQTNKPAQKIILTTKKVSKSKVPLLQQAPYQYSS